MNNKSKRHNHRTLIEKMSLDDLNIILEECYGISTKDIDPKMITSTSPDRIYKYAVQILSNNGLISPALQFRPLDLSHKYNTTLESHCPTDLALLTYIVFLLDNDNNKPISLEHFHFADGLKGRVKELEATGYGYMLGINRYNNDPKKYAFKISESTNKKYKHFHRKLPRNSYIIKDPCIPIIDTLVYLHKKNPFIISDYEKKINENAPNWEKNVNKYLSIESGDKSLLFLSIMKPRYRKNILKSAKNLIPFLTTVDSAKENITYENLKLFYDKWKKEIITYTNEPFQPIVASSKIDKVEYSENNNPNIAISNYLTEYIFDFKFCDQVNYKDWISDQNRLEILLFLSELPFCNTRMYFLPLYNDIYKKDYFYKGYVFKNNSLWMEHVYEHTLYTWECYMPALFYCFVYLYKIAYGDKSKYILQKYLKNNGKLFDFSVSSSIFKNESVISFYKAKLERMYSLYRYNDYIKPSDDVSDPLKQLKYKLRIFPNNLF